MSFEERQKARTSLLGVLVTFFRALAIGYLCLHAAVTWFAYQATGLFEALITLVLLGFGDLYWAVRWWPGDETGQTILALIAAFVCFASWLTRPIVNRWMNRFTIDMLRDVTSEIGRSAEARLDEPEPDDDAETTDRPGRPRS